VLPGLLSSTEGRGSASRLNVLAMRPILAAMQRSRNRRHGTSTKLASKAVWLGVVEAPDDTAAMEKAVAEFQGAGHLLMAIRW
jgi:hypothetical protein